MSNQAIFAQRKSEKRISHKKSAVEKSFALSGCVVAGMAHSVFLRLFSVYVCETPHHNLK